MNNDRKKPAIICLAAGHSQLIVIKKAKPLGLCVIAVDRNPESPGFKCADEIIIQSTYESGPIIQHLKALQGCYKLIGVINRASGPPVVTAAEICSEFNLPGVTPESARHILDKSMLMRLSEEHGIDVPACQSVSAIDQIDRSRIKFPCVFKPAISIVGKSGVRIVNDEASIPKVFVTAREAAINGVVNIEEYVPGRNISLMAVVRKGQLCPITLLDELNSVDDAGRLSGVGFAVPSVFSGRIEESYIIELAEKIIDVFNINTSAFNMSCRCDVGGKPKLIEIHLDLGGDLILDALLPASSSADVLGFLIRSLTADSPSENWDFSPAAVIYNEGDGLVSERPFRVIHAPDRESLEYKINTMERTINA